MIRTHVTMMVADYDQWRAVFESVEGLRQQYGVVSTQVFVNAENPNEVTVVGEWSDEARTRQFFASQELRDAMAQGGVQGPPQIKFLVDRT